MSSSSVEPGGLELLNVDSVTPEELEQFRAFYSETKNSQNKSYEFWLEFRPEVVKRHKARTVQWHTGPKSLCSPLAPLHVYVIQAFPDGIEYEMVLAQTMGAKKSDLLDLVSVAFIHSGHPGMYMVANTVTDFLRTYEEREGPGFPAGWEFDPNAFDSGMDYSSLEASREDLDKLFGWYEGTIGTVPGHVQMLAAYRPDLLKAYRNRYEHAIKESLPKQMLPYVHIHWNVIRGFEAGIRENVLLGRALGMTKLQLLDAIFSAVLHSGASSLDIAYEAVGDLLLGYDE
jgi:hypothetical protein